MSFSTPGRVNSFVGNGTADPLVTTFKVQAAADIKIVHFDDSADTFTPLVLGVDYTVSLGATLPSVATITPLAAITNPDRWFVYRQAPRTQLTDYTPGGNFPAESHEAALDRLTMMLDELSELETRCVRIRIDDDGENGTWASMVIPRRLDRASKVLAFDSNGAIIAGTLGSPGAVVFTTIGTNIAEAADAAAVRDLIDAVRNAKGTIPWATSGMGAIADRPTPASFGTGLFVATDEGRLYRSNASTWLEMVVRQGLQSALPTTPAGLLALATDSRQLYRASGSAAQLIRSFSPRYGHGCKVTWNSITSLSFAPGKYRNMLPSANDDALDLLLASSMTKLANATWASGTGNGGMAAGVHPLAANTWYYAFLIGTASGLIDIGYDTNISATNLLADAAVGTWAGGATVFARRIRAFRTKAASAQILEILQKADRIYYINLNGEPTEAGVGTTGFERQDAAGIDYFTNPVAISLPRIPPGAECDAHLHMTYIAGGGRIRLYPYGAAAYPTTSAQNSQTAWGHAQIDSGIILVHELDIVTDDQRRITAKAEVATGPDDRFQLALYSYVDPLDRI